MLQVAFNFKKLVKSILFKDQKGFKSTIIFVIYHVISISCEKLTKKLEISVFEGMWMPNIIFLIIAVFLTYKAKKDSELLLLEYYKIQFDKIKNLFKRK